MRSEIHLYWVENYDEDVSDQYDDDDLDKRQLKYDDYHHGYGDDCDLLFTCTCSTANHQTNVGPEVQRMFSTIDKVLPFNVFYTNSALKALYEHILKHYSSTETCWRVTSVDIAHCTALVQCAMHIVPMEFCLSVFFLDLILLLLSLSPVLLSFIVCLCFSCFFF